MNTRDNNSEIVQHSGDTMFEGPDAVRYFQARVVANGLRMYARSGLKPNRQWTPGAMLRAAGQITGKRHTRGQYWAAIDDLDAWADAMMSALPTRDERETGR